MGVDKVATQTTIGIGVLILLITLLSTSITFAGVVSGNDSIYTFNVTSCSSSVASVGCNATTIRFNCSLTPFAFIDEVQFYIEDVYYTTSRSDEWFWYDWAKPGDGADVNDTLSMTRQKITDVDNKSVLDFEVVNIDHDCDVCDATYNITSGACQTNNSQFNQYVSNDVCAVDYNATEYCNYCDSDWVARTGGIYDCNVSNSKVVFYDDFNTCYAITGLLEDAPPVDHNTTQSCSYYNTEMSCDVDDNPYLTDKINIVCEVPVSNDTFSCVTYIRPLINSSIILQSNPEYKLQNPALINIFGKENEPKEYFTPQGQTLHAYYTNKNIETDREFVVGIKCTSDTQILTSEYPVTPTYRGMNVVMNRVIWAKDNLTFIVILIIFIMLALSIIIGFIVKAVKRK